MGWAVSGSIRGPQGPEGPQGPKGNDGAGIAIAGSVATYAALPGGLTPADAGDGYLVEADGKLYIWSGTAFPADGGGVEFRGPQGPQGPAGEQGIQGLQGPQGDTGAKGDTGATGAKGDTGEQGIQGIQGLKGDQGVQGVTGLKGDTGAAGAPGDPGVRGSKWYVGAGAPGAIAGSMAGDMYLDTTDGSVYQLS